MLYDTKAVTHQVFECSCVSQQALNTIVFATDALLHLQQLFFSTLDAMVMSISLVMLGRMLVLLGVTYVPSFVMPIKFDTENSSIYFFSTASCMRTKHA